LGEKLRRLRWLILRGCACGAVMYTLLTASARSETGVVVKDIRLSDNDSTTRVVFDLNGPVGHRLFTLHDPERVVIDIDNAHMTQSADQVGLSDSVIENIRHAPRDVTGLRVVFDLYKAVTPKSFLLAPAGGYGHRLVVDLSYSGSSAPVIVAKDEHNKTSLRDVVVAIDAGHGGKDPGAIGPYGAMEKDVTLAVASRLEALIAKEPGMRPVMIRDDDVYLPLRERIALARQHKADLFISIHADASTDPYAQGSSVYVLSSTGASSEAARWLAERENAADLIGGVRLDNKDDTLARVLMDLSQTATIEASITLANDVLGAMQLVGPVRTDKVEQAGFVVLTSPDIPSVLVETAYISNPTDEQNLSSSTYQESLALAMLKGVREYFEDHPPPGTLLASVWRDRHVIRDGETLSGIATRYNINVDQLRSHNSLDGDMLHVGQVILIPTSVGGASSETSAKLVAGGG
jgi:N-acetylmuramoyl-L-alanine amidase